MVKGYFERDGRPIDHNVAGRLFLKAIDDGNYVFIADFGRNTESARNVNPRYMSACLAGSSNHNLWAT